jgi:hypothetical protein
MDYQVFLLSRIRERYTQTGSTTDGITHGVSSTARLITGAVVEGSDSSGRPDSNRPRGVRLPVLWLYSVVCVVRDRLRFAQIAT